MDFAPFIFTLLRSILEFMDIAGGITNFIDAGVEEVGGGSLGLGFFDLLFGQDFAFSGFNFGDNSNSPVDVDGNFTLGGFLSRIFGANQFQARG